ncbi:MAG: response regulator [Gammaproteobacteria bacterium]
MKKILIVDDSTFMRNVLKDILRAKDGDAELVTELEFFEANGITTARQQIKKVNPDAILLDIVMQESETEGVEFLREIKSFFDTSKVIIISSIGQIEILDECNKLGVKFYIQKPFVHSKIIDAVNHIIK